MGLIETSVALAGCVLVLVLSDYPRPPPLSSREIADNNRACGRPCAQPPAAGAASV